MSDIQPPRVLITMPFDEAGVERLRQVAELDLLFGLTPEQLESIIGEYHALIVSSERRISDRTIEYGYQLQVIGVAGASLEHLNVSAARAQGVEVINVPDRRTLARAEQTLEMMLSLAHRTQSVGLAGKTLGIVGYGGLGHEVARRARAFGMHVLVHQPRLTPELALEVGAEVRELYTLLANSDCVCLLLPTSRETDRMIGVDELNCMPADSFLISTGSPEAIDLQALIQKLESGQLSSAGLAVPPGWQGFQTLEQPENLMLNTLRGPSLAEAARDVAINLADQVAARLRVRQPSRGLSLRVVALDSVFPHEHFDPKRVADLAAQLKTADTLVNPPVVAEWKGKYVVLDGATRVQAFKQLGYPHIAVQVVASDDDRLVLHTWYHAVVGLRPKTLMDRLQAASEYTLQETNLESMQTAVDSGEVLCGMRLINGKDFLISAVPNSDSLTALNRLVSDYSEIGQVTRTLSAEPTTMSVEDPSTAALIIFPQFRLEQVLEAAVHENLLPAGITRFVIPGRVLRLCADLGRLMADEPLAHKNAWLDRMLAEKLARRRVRYYQEPVIVLDD